MSYQTTITSQAAGYNVRLQNDKAYDKNHNEKELNQYIDSYCRKEPKAILWAFADREKFDDKDTAALREILILCKNEDIHHFIHFNFGDSKSVLHKAVAEVKTAFINNFLSLLENQEISSERRLAIKIEVVAGLREQDENTSDSTCLHTAIRKKMGCVIKMIELCAFVERRHGPELYDAIQRSSKQQVDRLDGIERLGPILCIRDNKGNTILHLLLDSLGKTQISALTRAGSKTESIQYDSMAIINRIEDLYQPMMKELWLATNSDGLSPFRTFTEGQRVAKTTKNKLDHLQQRIKDKIYKSVSDVPSMIPNLKRALYGTKSEEKELSLDMSDFNKSSHDFKEFVQSLTRAGGRNALQFEECLVSVFLADLNTFKKPVPYDGVAELFQWLNEKGKVKRIRSLNIPDNTSIPMTDEYVLVSILDRFEIERFVWRKLDINLDILLSTPHKDVFTDITLYSTGNFSVLYHWASKDGIGCLPNLEKLTIEIVSPNKTNQPKAVQERQQNAVLKYHQKLEGMLQARKEEKEDQKKKEGDGSFTFQFKINPDTTWDFPAPRFVPQRSDDMHKLELIQRMEACRQFLMNMKSKDDCSEFIERFENHDISAMRRRELDPKCIKVAIIDNGADKFQYPICDCIERGISYVTADNDSMDRVLPWWMVSDPHGTQMASLVMDANPWCQLYIARVGKGRRDILPKDAAQAIKWAIEQKVDIISISWVIKSEVPELEAAIELAVEKKILVFCSTADRGTGSEKVYPACYDGTIRISATDKYGNLMPSSDNRAHSVNIPVPGEDIPAVGPSYMSDTVAKGTVSGSSVATALAAGMASLSLLLLMVFNNKDKQALRNDGLYGNSNMGNLLSVAISTPEDTDPLFPSAAKVNDLPNRWRLAAIKAIIKSRPVS